jgi:cell wall-associated NlpC family hydrolase
MANPEKLTLDKRLNLYRPDLAEEALRGRIEAARFVAGTPMQIGMGVASLRRQPSPTSIQLTQALPGETLHLFDEHEGWGWVKLDRDGYVGHIDMAALVPVAAVATHEVATPSTFLYPKADLKTQPARVLPMHARVAISGMEKDYAATATGDYLYKRHLQPVGSGMGDFVAVAERFLFSPYYWGGKTVHGLDCSGLVQLSLHAVGHPCLRDSDMQEATLGATLPPGEKLRRGDLVFWDGHVGIMADGENLLHANGFHMMVVVEPLSLAAERSAKTGKTITSVRRI